MAKRTSAWALLAAALVASQVFGGGIARPLDGGPAAYGAGGHPKAYDHARLPGSRGDASAQFDPDGIYGEGRDFAKDDTQALEEDRPAANPGGMAGEITVRAARAADGKAIEVVAELVLPLSRDVVWAVLNDYENMPRFVPDILSTRMISAGPGKKRVEIEGVARLLFLEFPTHTTLDVVHQPDGSIALRSVAGNLSITGVVRVHGDGPTTKVDYRVSITPDFWLPPLIGDFLIRRQIERQLEGMVAEMHRRAGSHQMGWAPRVDLGPVASSPIGETDCLPIPESKQTSRLSG